MFASETRKLPSSPEVSRPSKRIVLPSGVYCLHFAKHTSYANSQICQRCISRSESEAFAKHQIILMPAFYACVLCMPASPHFASETRKYAKLM
jgi:hypothetical protein